MFNSIAYDNEYNHKIASWFNALNSKNQNPEPDNFFKNNVGLYKNGMVGGNRNAFTRQIGGSRPYLNVGVYDRDQKESQKIVPGVNASMIPYYHQYELNKIDNNLSDFQGGNVFKKIGRTIKKVVKNPTVKKIISSALDVGAPIAGKALGTLVGQPILGAQAATIGRKILKESTGYGKKGIALYKGEGVKSGGCCPKEGKGVKSGGVKSGGAGPVSGGKRINKRAEIVKKIMKEKKMSMIQASKYVKDNNLY